MATPLKAEEEFVDKAWPDDGKIPCHETIKKSYDLVLNPDQYPSDFIMNRLDNDWRDKNNVLLPLEKMKTSRSRSSPSPPPRKRSGWGSLVGRRRSSCAVDLRSFRMCHLAQSNRSFRRFK